MPIPRSHALLFQLLDRHASWRPTVVVPELSAWQAEHDLPLWQALEDALRRRIPPPFFALAWPGALALSLALTDGRLDVRGLRVAEIGAGSGLPSAAARRAGATAALALDVDPLAGPASGELARRNGVHVDWRTADALSSPESARAADVILAADVVYEAGQLPHLRRAVTQWRRHARVVLADSGRPFFEPCGLPLLFRLELPVAPGVEGVNTRTVRVFASG